MPSLHEAILDRANGVCELCGATDGLAAHAVAPRSGDALEDNALLCPTCTAQILGTDLDDKHWFCLQESAWSGVPAVQVLAWRLLGRLSESWAHDLRDQLWLDDDTRAWAEATATEAPPTLDSNGTKLSDGDSVTLIKDLDVKGAGFTAKRGTLVKNIRLTDDPGLVEGRVNKVAIFLKTEFLKRAG